MRAKRKRKISLQPRFFVILTVLIVLIATPCVLLATRQKHMTLYTGALTQRLEADAVVIRRETVVAAQQTGQIDMLVAEGTIAAQGEDVVQVYSADYDADALDDLAQLRDRIITYQRHDILGDVFDADLAMMDAQIDDVTGQIADAAKVGDHARMRQLSRALDDLLAERSDYLRRNYRIDDELSSMLQQEKDLQQKIDNWTTVVQSPHAGHVSFYMDGCEHLLNADMLQTLDARSLASAVSQASQKRVTQAAEYTSLFRVVDPSGFYLALPLDESMELVQGKTYRIDIREAGQSYTATLLIGDQYTKNGLHVFFIEEDPSSVLRLRNVHITIEKSFEGLCITRRALQKQDGQYGVYVLSGQDKTFIPVSILARQGKELVIESPQLAIGQMLLLK
ncbi:MAG: hypothetical protein J6L88_01155 [Clostridia bacterium]|nr:hypothetical protein [Clostridia bacterium]